jgi:hypothetical protein
VGIGRRLVGPVGNRNAKMKWARPFGAAVTLPPPSPLPKEPFYTFYYYYKRYSFKYRYYDCFYKIIIRKKKKSYKFTKKIYFYVYSVLDHGDSMKAR